MNKAIGSAAPDVYIVGPNPVDEKSRMIGGQEEEIFLTCLLRADVTNYRFANLSEKRLSGDVPESVKKTLLEDVRRTKPKVIIALGRTAASAFVTGHDAKSVTKMAQSAFEWHGIPVKIIYHPTYVLRKGGRNPVDSAAAMDYVDQIAQAAGTQVQTANEWDDKLKIPWKLVSTPDQWEEAREYLERFSVLGYDTETNAAPKYSDACRIIGIGLASRKKSFYILPSAFKGGTIENRPFGPVVKLLLSRKKVLVYNAPFEHGVLFSNYGVVFENFFDVSMLARVCCYRRTLKSLSRELLGAPNWSDSVAFLDGFTKKCIGSLVIPGSGKLRPTFELLREGWSGFVEALPSEMQEQFGEVSSLLRPVELENYRKRLLGAAKRNERAAVYFHLIPKRIVGEYCCADAAILFPLREALYNLMDEKERKSYPRYHDQGLLACEMERVGACWDDERATEIETCYHGLLAMTIKAILLFPAIREALNLTTDDIEEILVTDDWDHLRKKFLNPISSHPKTTGVMSKVIRTKAMKLALAFHELEAEPPNYPSYFSKFAVLDTKEARIARAKAVKREVLRAADELTKLKAMKEPTDPVKKNARADTIKKLTKITDKATRQDLFDSLKESERKARMLEVYREFLKVVRKNGGSGIMDMDDNTREALWENLNATTLSFKDEFVTAMLSALPYMGVRVDDGSTMEEYPEAFLLVFLRYLKKVFKGLSTYIDGKKVGRGQVYCIEAFPDTKIAENPSTTVLYKRVREYEPGHPLYVLQTDYYANGAETKRWRSAAHTIPGLCELRDIYSSRFHNGLMMHNDMSQAEIRVMAFLAKCKALLDALESGETDIHRFVGSKMWKKDPAAVSEAERRIAKTGTFLSIFGGTAYNLAMNHLHGDLAAAEEVFKILFDAFPEIKQWIDRQHKTVLKEGWVRALFGDKLYIEVPSDDPEARENWKSLRQSQNWPVQNGSSNLVGWSLWQATKEFRKRGLRACVTNFQHDSGDFDVHAADIFDVGQVCRYTMQELPREVFKVPVTVDLEIGSRMNSTGDLEHLVIENQGRRVSCELTLRSDRVEETMTRMGSAWKFGKRELIKEKNHPIPFSELFLARRAFSRDIGKTFTVQTIRLELTKKKEEWTR